MVAVSGTASSISPTVAGTVTSTVRRSAQSSVELKCCGDFSTWCADRPGRITVASAIEKTPIGNSTSRSA